MLGLEQTDDKVHISRKWFNNGEYHFHLINSIDQFKKLIDICIERKICSLDLETTGVDNRVYPDEYFKDGIKTKFGMRSVDKIVGFCISFDGSNGYYIPVNHEPEDSQNLPEWEAYDEVSRLIHNCRIIFHNSKFDQTFIYPVTGKDFWKNSEFEDTMLMAGVYDPLKRLSKGLKSLTKKFFEIDMIELDELFTKEKQEQLKLEKKGKNFGVLHPKEGVEYGSSDGIFTYKLYWELEKLLDEDKSSINDHETYELEKRFCYVVRRMEQNRVHLDLNKVKLLSEECDKAIAEITDIIRSYLISKTGSKKWGTLNIGSVPQISEAFFMDHEGLRLDPIPEMIESSVGSNLDEEDGNDEDGEDEDKTVKAKFTLKDQIVKLVAKKYSKLTIPKDGKDHNVFNLILEYRHYDKMRGSFISKFMKSHDEYGDVRPSFNQMGTDTTRLSARAGEIKNGYSGVNFQGIPRDTDEDKPELFKRIRECIIPRPGKILVKIDYAGEELRVVTNLSGDKVWKQSFLHGDGDVHAITTRFLYGKKDINKDERNRGKKCNFAIIYGGGAGAVARNIECSMQDASRMLNNLREGLPELMSYGQKQINYAKKHKCVRTSFGRRIPIEGIDHEFLPIRRKAERCAMNYVIQSTSADILKYAMCLVDKNIRQRGWEDKLKYVMTVHDEVVYEITPDILQEAVKLLDEWMVYPCKLPMRTLPTYWEVPLETEALVDSSWRAKYNYVKMVSGIKAKPTDFKDGKFIGKLGKDEFFENGKIYQNIPDLLKPHLHREDGIESPKIEEQIKEVEEPEPESEPELSLDNIEIQDSNDLELEETETIEIKKPELKPNGKKIEPIKWTLNSTLSNYTMRKLQAVCILAEGETPLRIELPGGKILIDENKGVHVEPATFMTLSVLFGL